MSEGGGAYVVASRQGLFLVDRRRWRRLAEGLFFGLAVRGADLYAFKAGAIAEDSAGARSGSIVRYACREGELGEPEVLVAGLHDNCHQIEFFEDAFFVVDSFNQRVLEYDAQWRARAVRQLLAPAAFEGPDYAHVNSIHAAGDAIYVMLHNGKRRLPSEIVRYDRDFREQGRVRLASSGCHDIVRLEDGALVYCDSTRGTLARDDGPAVKIDDAFTRGLAVGPDEIAVGSSLFGSRVGRILLPGFVTFLDRAYNRLARLYVPAAPTQIRRLEVAALTLSDAR